jgi:hypothetical protein
MKNALVPVAPLSDAPLSDEPTPAVGQRPHADFVAHLIATAVQAPQTRARRRAEPQVALAAYRAVGQWPSEAGRALSRSL